ncbi:MAG: hypothetical protein LUD12_02890 [Lachnospiraceae bacterium]|nr:hypothetical protein [Lachnospiraceae bacterium]
MSDVFTALEDLPPSIAGYTVVNPDDTYTIILNTRVTHERQLEAYQHEIRHIQEQDFEKEDVQEIESTAHNVGSDYA